MFGIGNIEQAFHFLKTGPIQASFSLFLFCELQRTELNKKRQSNDTLFG